MEFPITVQEIVPARNPVTEPLFGEAGCWVSVRPCGEQYHGKTYLGVLLGELPISMDAVYLPASQTLELSFVHNPAIWIPQLKKIVWGAGSWWGRISSPEKLREITNEDIDNVWYVRALKELTEKQKG